MLVSLTLSACQAIQGISKQKQGSMANNQSDANQIVFAVKKSGNISKFSNLQIEGENQNGSYSSYYSADPNTEKFLEETTNWWWRGTIILTFNINGQGTQTCIVDNLRLDGSNTEIVYNPDYHECSGSSSAVSDLQTVKEYQELRKFIKSTDAYQIITLAKWMDNPNYCIGKIKEVLTTKVGEFNLVWCKSVNSQAKQQLTELLMDYGLKIIYGN